MDRSCGDLADPWEGCELRNCRTYVRTCVRTYVSEAARTYVSEKVRTYVRMHVRTYVAAAASSSKSALAARVDITNTSSRQKQLTPFRTRSKRQGAAASGQARDESIKQAGNQAMLISSTLVQRGGVASRSRRDLADPWEGCELRNCRTYVRTCVRT